LASTVKNTIGNVQMTLTRVHVTVARVGNQEVLHILSRCSWP